MRPAYVAVFLMFMMGCHGGDLPVRPMLPPTPPLWLRVQPAIAIAPSDVFVMLRIARHADNRAFVVVMNAEDNGYRLTAESLDGIESRVVYSWFWREMPAGTYLVRAILLGVQGVRARAHQTVSLQ